MLEKLSPVIGAALEGVRPGPEKTVAHGTFADAPATIEVHSPDFTAGAPLPVDVTEDGRKVSPALRWNGVPAGAAEVVLVVEDADSPTPAPLVHLLAWGLPPNGQIDAGVLDGAPGLDKGIALGKNSFLRTAWLPPDPPPGHGPHRYMFQVFALGAASGLSGAPGRGEVVAAMAGKVLAKGVLIGTFERR